MADFDIVTRTGAFVGLLTGIFVLYDRFVGGRPVVTLLVTGQPSNFSSYIYVKNVSPRSVTIRRIHICPRVLSVAKDDSLNSVVRAVVGQTVIATLAAGEERLFPVLQQGETPNRRAWIVISWRKASSVWLPQFPMILRASSDDLKHMAQGL